MDRKLENSGRRTRRLVLLVACGAAVLAAVWGAVNAGRGGRLRVSTERLDIATVEVGEFREYVPVTGTVVPVITHYIDSVEGGVVEAVFRDEGSMVEAGDEILRLSNTSLLLDVTYREAELANQTNQLRNTKIAMDQNQLLMRRELLDLDRQITRQGRVANRLAHLMERGLVSRQEFEESQDELEYLIKNRELLTTTQLQDSLARVEQIRQFDESLGLMRSNLDLIRKKLDGLVVRAPVSGLLSALDAEVGQVKSAGDRLGQIDILDGFKVRAAVDEHYITRVRRGQTASLLMSGTEHKLVVDKVYPRVVSGRFDVDLVFVGNEIEDLRRGRTIQLRLELSDPSTALLLPQGAFLSATGGRWVYLLDDSGDVARRHDIVIGSKNPQYCEILEGLESGDRVIVSSYGLFGDADELILK